MAELLIGCGHRRDKEVHVAGCATWKDLVTLDMNPDARPDIEWNLERLPYSFAADNEYDEIHAYEVLEHVGQQGDWRFFFDQFSELWRILKPDGVLAGSCPPDSTRWTWGDPGHRRLISDMSLAFLDQAQYTREVGKTSLTDYRHWYKADFAGLLCETRHDRMFFALRAVKPSRISL